jgi:hypothetical protein
MKRLAVGSAEVEPRDWEEALVQARAQGDSLKVQIAGQLAIASVLGDLLEQLPIEVRSDYSPELRQRILKVQKPRLVR